MGVAKVEEAYPPESLMAAGWRLGTLFRLPGARYAWNDAPGVDPETTTQLKSRLIKDREFMVVASQDCDILSKDEPRVEAILVRSKDKPTDRGYLARIANSYREFVLDPERGLVADARIRVPIAKGVFCGIEPEPWSMDDRTKEDFVDWLASRYDRPPIPTPVYEALCRPVREEIKRLERDESAKFSALNRSVYRIRVRLPPPGSPSLDLGLLLILENDINQDGADAVEVTIEEIRRLVAEGNVPCNLEVEQVLYGELLLQEFNATRPIDLDYMTDRGDEVTYPHLDVFNR